MYLQNNLFRTWIVTLFFILSHISLNFSFLNAADKYTAPRMPDNEHITLDGKLSEPVWSDASSEYLAYGGKAYDFGRQWRDTLDCQVSWKAAWSESTQKLYVAIRIKDDIKSRFDDSDPENGRPWKPEHDDSIEFFTDADHSGGIYFNINTNEFFVNAQQWRFIPIRDGKKTLHGWQETNRESDHYTGDDFKAVFQYQTGGDWICEAEFQLYEAFATAPEKRIKKVLRVGESIGWDLWYNDSDNDSVYSDGSYTRNHQLGWHYQGTPGNLDESAMTNADYFGELVLGNPAIRNSIEVTAPSAGDVWKVGTTQRIAWNFTGNISTVSIALSRDEGQTWQTIRDDMDNSGVYNWTVRGPGAPKCQVKVADIENPTVYGISSVFTIADEDSLALVQPNGGETWFIGSVYPVKWTSQGDIDSILVAFSMDNGENWQTLARTANSGIFQWEVKGQRSRDCLIKIQALHNPMVFDASDAVFTINEPKINIQTPDSNSVWYLQTEVAITWEFIGPIETVSIELSRNDGTDWESLASGITNNTVFLWNVAGSLADSCRIRIWDTSNPAIADTSARFSIRDAFLKIIAPNGGENWWIGSEVQINWQASENIESVSIEISYDNGTSWQRISNGTSDRNYKWIVIGSPSSNCRIRIVGADQPQYFDVSDQPFTILEPASIKVTNPAADVQWAVGSTQQITWTSTGNIPVVQIRVSRDSGNSWMLINEVVNEEYYLWKVSAPVSNSCIFEVRDRNNITQFGRSGVFSIYDGKSISVLAPNGGEIWDLGTAQTIQWSTTGNIAVVRLEISRDNGSTWAVIQESVANNGEFTWEVSGDASVNCRIKITDISDRSVQDVSDNPFQIAEVPAIQVLSPRGNTTWIVGSTQNVVWSASQAIEKVRIKLSRDNRTTWENIANETENTGSYQWIVTRPAALSSCHLRILNCENDSIFDETDHGFSILESETPITLSLTSPGASDTLQVGSVHPIQWTFNGDSILVKIELSRDGGLSWQELATTSSVLEEWSWQVLPPTGDDCRFRIADLTGSYRSVSAPFFITAQMVNELQKPAAQPAGTEEQAYRLISIPLLMRLPNVDSILVDDLGNYDPTAWRLFDLKQGEYHEYPDVSDFTPGKSKLLIVRATDRIIDAGPGFCINGAYCVIPLDSGWNFVANPYEERFTGELTEQHLQLLDCSDPITLYSYEGAWGISTTFKPWTGYALKTTRRCNLRVQPDWTSQVPNPKIVPAIDGWRIQIKAYCANALDTINVAGVYSGASLNWDIHDLYEPPPIGKYVSVFFPHHNWPIRPDVYTVDIQPELVQGNRWDFSVETNIKQAPVKLTFCGIEKIARSRMVKLLDLKNQVAVDLVHQNEYTFYVGKEVESYKFRLLVGASAFIEQQEENFAALTEHFLLHQNYPNPFNSETVIKFILPEAGNVNLAIYNVLGKLVRHLLNEKTCEAGYYSLPWDGKNDNGEALPSGIYFYRLQHQNGMSIIKKMVLVR